MNEIIPHLLYQRGQILSWPIEAKRRVLAEHGIRLVVNFWPKLDVDFQGLTGVDYWFVPRQRAIELAGPDTAVLARAALSFARARRGAILVLCEAGRTRSVYFCAHIVAVQMAMSITESLEFMRRQLQGRVALKPFMFAVPVPVWQELGL